ncbi:hypothetical protein ACIA71_20900 [Streptomyces anulatus]|uniref:hypothetical protein n=1 Tax=Streptomyces anulatus TaxID=1892 RepID=UPI001C5F587D|nr:hypothetical protein [Streptomyces anulatus]QYA99606.1 hypothetical protein KZO11_30065 [Streptomyces anulatus]
MFARPGGDDAITEVYSVPDDARYLEPDLVRDQRALATAIVPDEDPERCAPRPLRQGTAPLNQTSR